MSIEVRRNPDGSLDEIVAVGASIHLEQMDGKCWWLCVTKGGEEVRLFLTSRRRIKANVEGHPGDPWPEGK